MLEASSIRKCGYARRIHTAGADCVGGGKAAARERALCSTQSPAGKHDLHVHCWRISEEMGGKHKPCLACESLNVMGLNTAAERLNLLPLNNYGTMNTDAH